MLQALGSGIASGGRRGAAPSGGFGVTEISACSQGQGHLLSAVPRSSSTYTPSFSDTSALEIIIFWCPSLSSALVGQYSRCWPPQAVVSAPLETARSAEVREQVGKGLGENIQESDGLRDNLCPHRPAYRYLVP